MEISLRSISGASQTFQAQPDQTVMAIKDFLAAEYDKSSLKLCFRGKVLEDDKTFSELGFSGGEAIIIAGKRLAATTAPKAPTAAAPAPAPASATPVASPPVGATTSAPVATPAPTPAASTQPAAQPTPAQAPVLAPRAAAPNLPVPDESLVQNLMAMGFEDRAQITLALRAAYMNPDRAVEYLCSGIPPNVLAQIQEASPVTAPAPTAQRGASALEQALRNVPQFEQIREVVRQSPGTLPTVMQQLRERHPDVFRIVQQNPQEFIDIMNGGGSTAQPAPAPSTGLGALGGLPADVLPSMQVTEDDHEPIQRLTTLGGGMWDERAATVMYIICNRNEEIAANLLFDHGGLPPELSEAMIASESVDAEAQDDSSENSGN